MTTLRLFGIATTSLCAAMLIGCDSDELKPGDTVKREGQPPVTYVADDDPKMVAAIKKSRSTVGQFVTALSNPKPSQSAFSVKVPVEDGDKREHMWITPVRYRNGTFFGTISNEPVKVTTVKNGDKMEVAKDQISDWMYIENKRLKGGYTLRVMRDRMPEKERAEFDRSIPFTIE